ncbi:hypothetical protein [Chryseobacterium sp. MFBS3-17]|uniref:hypothetical protein n=1 Tax=Chryseobacterium sp. MFBS3-17 TaxID=2886689 RepID=UPI001D0DCCC1|nr:hypothetical protein [Chryseobacterium sp. MFBS3-17]MCC2590404.1 hypothetical protein [Chryseobacterium sp. MFBS3-17]
MIIKQFFLILMIFFLFSCKKEEKQEKIFYDNGKIKYVRVFDNDILKFNRYDREGNLMFVGKFKDNQLIDTLFIYDNGFEYFEKIDSSDNKYFYTTFISRYSTGKLSEISRLRYRKGVEIDSILGSSLLFGKETNYKPNGEIVRERTYKITGDVSKVIDEKNYDSW